MSNKTTQRQSKAFNKQIIRMVASYNKNIYSTTLSKYKNLALISVRLRKENENRIRSKKHNC